MEVPRTAEVLGHLHFSNAVLGDHRRTQRLVRVAQAFLKCNEGSMPDRFNNHADLTAFYRLMDCPQVTHRSVLEPHLHQTRQAIAAEEGVVLLIHDTTELDYTSHRVVAESLGSIGDGHSRGYLCHNSLAMSEDGRVLGLAEQILHLRREVPKGESPKAKRSHPDRQSLLWLRGCASTEGLRDTADRQAGRWLIDVADRGADTFEFLDYELSHQRDFVIRVAKTRNLAGEDHVGEDRIHTKLIPMARDLVTAGTRKVPVAATTKKSGKARMATVRLAAASVRIDRPHFCRGYAEHASIEAFVIHVAEVNPPAGVEPVEWVLLSSVPCETFAQIERVVSWYERRPAIEDYHKGMKTGCNIEWPQMETRDRLEPVIGLISVVAVLLLQLRHLSRDEQHAHESATAIVPKWWVELLSMQRWGERRELTIRQFCLALAGLGGHLNRKSDGMPGWQTLWKGWRKFQLMLLGAELIRQRKKCVER